MLTVYGRLMPLRILEEVRFWKMQEKEQALFVRELTPALEPQYQQLLSEWHDVFSKTEQAAQHYIRSILESDKKIDENQSAAIKRLAEQAVTQSNQWIDHQKKLLEVSESIRSSPSPRTAVHHVINQSEYFLGVLNALLETDSFSFRQIDDEMAYTAGVYQQVIGNGWNEFNRSDEPDKAVPIGGHTLPPLPYAYDALEPYIDEQTMRLHHDKHHKSYVDGLNNAEKMLKTARETNDFELIKHWEREAAFHGAGHYLHTIFWNIMHPDGGGKADGPIAAQIDRDFGSFERFKQHFTHAADKVEGGGWAILVWSPRSHRLQILQAEKHQNLTQWDVIPLLVLDVWEHAYYLKYQNERKKYIDAWWNVVNWDHVNERFAQARRVKWMPY